MILNEYALKEAARRGLEAELLPIFNGTEAKAETRLRVRMDRDLPELAERMARAALRGDHDMVEVLEGVPVMWAEQVRVQLTELQAWLSRATVRSVFRILIEVAHAA